MAISLADLQKANGNKGLTIPGKFVGDRLGGAVESAGDFNGDGFDDLVVTAPEAGITNTNQSSYYESDRRGKAYVIFGTGNNGSNAVVDLDSLNGSKGFTVSGLDPTNQLGSAVSAGDLNGDGVDDLILGAPQAGLNVNRFNYSYSENNGEAYVIFGQKSGFQANFDLRSLNGSNGFTLKGVDASDFLGTAVASGGDLNGDGIDDLAVSAPGGGQSVTNSRGFTSSNRSGETYVLFGKKTGFESRIDLFNLNGSNGFIVEGKDAKDSLGGALSNVGDINGDRLADLVIGAPNAGKALASPFANGDSDQRGEVYLVYGSKNGFNPRFSVANYPTISGTGLEDNLGSAVSSAGDLNGDGIDDLILGAANASVSGEYSQEGQVYVLFGRQGGFGNEFDLNSLNGNNGFSITGVEAEDGLGNAVSAGDFNDDGFDDLLVGASLAGQDSRGAAYVIFGKGNGFTSQLALPNLSSNVGMQIPGLSSDDLLGSAVSSGGDLNGDGADDLVVSGTGVDLGDEYTREGTAYVIFGTPAVKPPTKQPTPYSDRLNGTVQNDTISGDSGDDTISGGDGNDLLNGDGGGDSLFGDGGQDTLNGGNNNDTLYGAAGNDLLDGGNNQDRLFGDEGNDSLLGGTDNDVLTGGVGNDTLNGTNPNNFELQLGEQDTLSGGADRDLFVLGDKNQVYYSDRNSRTEGSTDYALIKDFNPAQDQIQLQGERSLYSLSFFTDSKGNTLGNLVYLQPGAVGERVGILQNVSPSLTLDHPAFSYLSNKPTTPVFNVINGATPYNDRLNGTVANDQISGNNGNDTISGGDGNDLLNGDGGGDSLFGDGGQDTLNGGNNNDTLYGAAGNDLLDGGNNQDRLFGDEGNDSLLGGTDNDVLTGGVGNDTLNGTNPNNFELQLGEQDTLSGGADRDLFVLGDKNQVYYSDRNSRTEGSTDYALIKDFNPAQDQIQLKGSPSLYSLSSFSLGNGSTLTNIFYLEPDGSRERVGIIEDVSPDLTINHNAFSFI